FSEGARSTERRVLSPLLAHKSTPGNRSYLRHQTHPSIPASIPLPVWLREWHHPFDRQRRRTHQDWRGDPRSKAPLPPPFQNSDALVQTICSLPPVCPSPAASDLEENFSELRLKGCMRSR